ncbi:MAG: type II toxin-antitoxin system VapC family toxin [Bryobacteraceae bacterium]|nr:type II toxin-antitoxin system VapC family toxin [Bryobacteraceae bacterium]
MPARLVVDTSVFAKFFLDEEGSGLAAGVLDAFESGECQLAAPDLLFMEFVNVLWAHAARGRLSVDDAREILEDAAALLKLVEVVPAAGFAEETLVRSIEQNHPAYDVAFLILAELLDAHVITADLKFARRVHDPRIIPLRDLA